jgi:tRNA (adenine57-N1/adenine58-N1)-methyltransferase
LNVSIGCFHHDSIIGRPYGSKITSFGKGKEGYIYILKPSPTLITETLARKTQILFSMDISAIIFKLNLLPGDTVVEAGTGSGSLSSSIATAIHPGGHLYTFEFNEERARITR